MNREVYFKSENDEIYLGTVGKITGAGGKDDWRLGQGVSATAVISDIVSELAFTDGDTSRTFTIELREPGVS